jgi:hypothetical protein
LIQPGRPIPAQAADDQIWQYFNNLPAASLYATPMSGSAQFYSNYAAALGNLVSIPLRNIQKLLGRHYPEWQSHLASLTPRPTPIQLPDVFHAWATANAPGIADAGRSAHRAALRDPLFMAQTMALNTSGFVNNVPNFTPGVRQLFEQLSVSGGASFQFDTAGASSNSNVTNTWCSGVAETPRGIFGVWDNSNSQLTQRFTGSRVTASIRFQRLLTFAAVPAGGENGWYSPAAFGEAYDAAQDGGAPWAPGRVPPASRTCGPDGNTTQIVSALVVADGLDVTVNSYARYDRDQQRQIKLMATLGFWPFYSDPAGGFTQKVTFARDSTMKYTMSSRTGNPLIVGAFVLPASIYLTGD